MVNGRGFLSSIMNVVCHRPICEDAYACPRQTVLSSQVSILRFVAGHLKVTFLTDTSSGSLWTVLTTVSCICYCSCLHHRVIFRVHNRNLGSCYHAHSESANYQGLHIGGCCCWFCRTSGNFLVESTPLPGTVIKSPVMGLAKSWMLGVEERTGCGDRKGVTGLDPGDADDSDTGGE